MSVMPRHGQAFFRPRAVNAQALFYIDVLLDVKQLFLFYSAGLHGYLLLNMIGMVLPIMFTSMEAVKFGRTPSPDLDFVSSFISPIALVPLLVFATVSQTLMLLLALVSATTGRPHGSTQLSAGSSVCKTAGSIPCSREPSSRRLRIAAIA